MRIGFFLREALRAMRRSAAPTFAALITVLVTMLVLGVFIPIVQATDSTANSVAQPGPGRGLHEDHRDRRGRGAGTQGADSRCRT